MAKQTMQNKCGKQRSKEQRRRRGKESSKNYKYSRPKALVWK
jgi:hypothetical protein